MIDQSKLIEVNFDNILTEMLLEIKHFLYIEIFSNVIKQQSDISVKKIKRFLDIKIFKRRQKNDDSNLNKLIIKIFKTILALTVLTASNETSYIVSSRSDIFTFTIYIKAVRNSI